MRRRWADGLFDRVAAFDALWAAALQAAAGKRRAPGPAAFLTNLETEVLRLERELRAGTWRPGGYSRRAQGLAMAGCACASGSSSARTRSVQARADTPPS